MPKSLLFINLPTMAYSELEKSFASANIVSEPLSLPLGILYLSSNCKRINPHVLVDILDYSLQAQKISEYKSIEQFIDEGVKSKSHLRPDILAFSLTFSTSHKFFTAALDALCAIWPEAVTAVGGNHATNSAKEILTNDKVKYLFKGEAELAFAEFISRLNEGKGVDGIPGIYTKATSDTPGGNGFCEAVQNLDDLPFPDWDLLEMEVYTHSVARRKLVGDSANRKGATFMSNRGLPLRMHFLRIPHRSRQENALPLGR